MRFIDAIIQHPTISIFGRIEGMESELDPDDITGWEFDPIDTPVLKESDISEFFIIKAKHVLPNGAVCDCYIDICLPERISDEAYFFSDGKLDVRFHHEVEGDIISAVPIDCFGVYDLFYSRIAPDVGIDILKSGLIVSRRKRYIAEDLGYILRDENRFAEAAEMFQIAVNEQPSSYFLYGELAACYDEIGNKEQATKYHALFNDSQ